LEKSTLHLVLRLRGGMYHPTSARRGFAKYKEKKTLDLEKLDLNAMDLEEIKKIAAYCSDYLDELELEINKSFK
jgi:hypothetical protein